MVVLIGWFFNVVVFKLVNFVSFDFSFKKRGIKGVFNYSKLDKEVWDVFNDNWEELVFESE